MAVMGKQVGYAVTTGCYSDYRVVALYARLEDAERYVATTLTERRKVYEKNGWNLQRWQLVVDDEGPRVEDFPFFPGDKPLGMDVSPAS